MHNKNLTVCHVSCFYPVLHNYWGGAQQGCKRWIELLGRAEGIKQILLTTPRDRDISLAIPHYEMSGIEGFFGGRWKELLSGIKVILFPFDPLIYVKCIRFFRRHRPDVIHLHNFKVLTFAVVSAARKCGIPTVFHIYDYWPLCPKDNLYTTSNRICAGAGALRCILCYKPKDKNPLFIWKVPLLFRKSIVRHFMRQIDAVAVLSEASRQKMAESGRLDPARLHVVRQYYNINVRHDPSVTPVRGLVLYVAWIAPNKGAHRFIEAASYVIKAVPYATFKLVGDQLNKSFLQYVQELIRKHGLSEVCKLLGRKSQEEVELLLQQCEVVVVPEQWENMAPIFLTEAMAWSKPIVASRIGGIPEFIEDGVSGWLAEVDSSQDFADKVIRLLGDREAAAQMGVRARDRIAQILDREAIGNKILSLYRTLASNRSTATENHFPFKEVKEKRSCGS